MLPPCDKCKTFGHNVKNCPLVPRVDPSDKKKDNMEWQQVPMKKGNFVEIGQQVSQGAMEIEQDGHGVRVSKDKGLDEIIEEAAKTVEFVNAQNKLGEDGANGKGVISTPMQIRASTRE
ncbi:hypothetical protein Acr_02g0010920 [Actinidia rufa]|uniref:Uncharacterized protein n=1 Tax=Actinidia rufa TaxID=165716 RepID=A0A7J0E977_9ERIC|nr:hypothetical protein Acr_02g0010920 [Actinidia rufa]